jgi:hypothetical protein
MEKLLLKLATSETGFGNPIGGLSEDAAGKMCGYAFEHANTKEELVSEVVNYAEIFEDFAKGQQAQLKEEGGQKEDVAAISALLKTYKKGIDLDKLRALSGAEWDDVKEDA